MKYRVLTLITIFFLGFLGYSALSSPVEATHNTPPCYTIGDVNNDGHITSADSTAAGGLSGSNPNSSAAGIRADVDDNNVIDGNDRLWIEWYYGGAVSTFPICPTPSVTKTPPPCAPNGNAYSADNSVNKFDVLKILEKTAGWGPSWTATELHNANVDGDPDWPHGSTALSSILSTDASLVSQYVEGVVDVSNGFQGTCPQMNVNSNGVSNAIISASQTGTDGTTPYSRQLNAYTDISTTLTALSVAGYTFTEWTGACSGISCTVSIVSHKNVGSKTVTANYVVVSTYTLTVNNSPSAGGTITASGGSGSDTSISCGSNCSGTYNSGSVVTLSAVAAAGYTFSSWTGNADCTDGSVTMNASKSCTANYVFAPAQPNTLQVRSTLNGNPVQGVVVTRLLGTRSTGGTTDYNFISSSDISTWLSAPPTFDGADFSSWTGCDDVDVSGTACRADLSENVTQTITANYTSSGCVDTLPAPASNPSPADGATNVAVTTNLDWTWNGWGIECDVQVNGYNLYFGTTNPPANVVFEAIPGSPTYDPPGDLTAGTTYYWQVRKCNRGVAFNCTDGPVWSFTTVGPPDLRDLPPRVYHTSGPFAGQTVSSTRPADPNEQLRGQIRFWESENKPSFQFNAHWWSNTGAIAEGTCNTSGIRESGIWTNGWNTTTYDVYFSAPGSPGTYEFWEYLDADCNIAETDELNNAEGVIYEVAGCVDTLPAAASGPSPGDGATNVAVTTNLGWTFGSWGTWCDIQENGYNLYFGTDPLSLPIVVQEARVPPGLSTYNPPGDLAAGTTYYWYVRQCNAGVAFNCTESPVWSFTTASNLPDLNAVNPRVYHRFGTWAGLAVTSSYPATTNEKLRGEIRFTEETDKPPFSFNARWWSNIGIVTSGTCFTTGGSLASGILTNGNSGVTVYGDELAEEENMYFDAPATSGTYNFYEYLDADGTAPICTITEGSEVNNVEKTVFEYPVVAPAVLNLDVTRFDLFKADCSTPLGSPLVGEDICFDADITNTSGNNITTPFTIVFWNHSTSTPVCNSSGFGESETIPSLFAGVTYNWKIVTAGSSTSGDKFARVFADHDLVGPLPNCRIVESNEDDNLETRGYSIGTTNWLQAIGGDVGAVNEIKMSNPGGSQTDYLLIADTINGGAYSDRWQVNNYNKPLVSPGGVYKYFNDRFGAKARATPHINCSSGSITYELSYCGDNTSLTLSAAPNLPASGRAVVFVDGNLTITRNIDLGSRSVVFVVRDSIIVAFGATNSIDGVYIAGGSFNDCFVTSCDNSSPLTVNGAIYANSFFQLFNRKIKPSGGLSLIVNYQPRYLYTMRDLLGTPSIVWREVAP